MELFKAHRVGLNIPWKQRSYTSPINIQLAEAKRKDKELDQKRDEIQMACTQLVLDDWSWYEQRASGKSQLFMICANTIFVCDAKNRQQAAMRAAQPISEEVQNKYDTL